MDIGKAEGTINLLIILAIVAGVGYAIYSLFNGSGPLSTDCSKVPSNCDPATGQYIGPWNAFNNWLFPENFPGGGEVTGSSETASGAFSNEIFHPIDTLDSIFGFNGSPATTQTPTTGGVPLSAPTQQLAAQIANGADEQ